MHGNNVISDITQLVIELAVIIIASWIARRVSHKIKIPVVVGYIFMGIILGPFVLGSIPLFPTFPHGIFPRIEATIPISAYLYGFSAIASILLLFMSGLKTDTDLFIRYSSVGSIVGLGGLFISFGGAYIISIFAFDYHNIHPVHLFMATIATATSVGITTAVLSEQHKINSPEGVTTLSAAVLDDVLGIIVLAIILGITENLLHQTEVSSHLLRHIGITAAKAIGLWLGCTILGIVFSRKLGRGMKRIFKDSNNIAVISLGCAFMLGGIFEIAGLSMVIGAYIVGLTLSNTDLAYVIQEKTTPITTMFTPIFFIVTGMLINLNEIMRWHTFIIGLIYAIVCIFAKIIGCGLPALFLGFNPLGALRIGLGMAPRGEIALIIAGIGINLGIMDDTTFGAVLIMIFISAIVSPYLLNILLKNPKSGTNKEEMVNNKIDFMIDFKNETLKRLILVDFIQMVEEEGFFINKSSEKEKTIYNIRKDDIFIVLTLDDEHSANKLMFTSDNESISFIKTALHEATANIAESSQLLTKTLDAKNIVATETKLHNQVKIGDYLTSSLVTLHIKSNTKEDIIKELVELLEQEDLLYDKAKVLQEIMDRENTFSTGLQEGIAIPHAKTQYAKKTSIVVGLKPEGVDFDSLDGKPSNIFVLITTTKDTPHLSILTSLSTLLNSSDFRDKVLSAKKRIEVVDLFAGK